MIDTRGAWARLRALRRPEALADAAGLLAMLLVLLDYVRPSLLWLPTVAAGGDTPCHYPTLVWFYERLLPRLRLHGWYPGAYLGQPLLLYYFPLPFLLMAAAAPAVGLPVAFKLGTVGGVFALPVCAWACFRLLGFRSPTPLLGAAASFVFLFCEENPIWGGTLASTLTGEFSYTYGIALALVFLGVAYRAHERGASPWGPAAILAVTALAHGYAVLWAGLSATYLLYVSRRPARTLRWLVEVAALAFAFAGLWILPLLSGWGWTTPYDDPWITVVWRNLLPPLLWPLVAAAIGTLAWTALLARARRPVDHRLLFLAHAVVVGAALAAAAPAVGIIDVRFVPFAQLAACLVGGAGIGLALERMAAPRLAALAVTLVAILYADGRSQVLRSWIDWNYTGLEAKELWPAFREVTQALEGTVADPRVDVEYAREHEKAGSIRMYETLPLFSGRSTTEGVYNQASLQTHPVYYLSSEVGPLSPNPFRKREYSHFDPQAALAHLRLFNVGDVIALSPQLVAALDARPEATRAARVPPYTVFHLDTPARYVEPLAFQPVRSPRRGWRDRAYRWFTRKPMSRAFLVFTDDPRFTLVERDEWLAPPEVPLPGGVEVSEQVRDESIAIHTSRVGHPLLVKVSYHPRWKAEGADGPYLVSPALMMIVPRRPDVRLVYAKNASDLVGIAITLAAAVAALARWRVRRSRLSDPPVAPGMPGTPDEGRGWRGSWGAVIPAGLVVLLAVGRVATLAGRPPDPQPLYERASKAYAEGRFDDAAEYARNGIPLAAGTPLEAELRTLRGESLIRAGRPGPAAEAFQAVVDAGGSPYVAQALFGLAQSRAAAGDPGAARVAEERLRREFSGTPWARRLAAAAPAPVPSP